MAGEYIKQFVNLGDIIGVVGGRGSDRQVTGRDI